MIEVVPLSGGWDSAYCLVQALRTGNPVRAVFFNYGQPYLLEEGVAARKIAQAFGVDLVEWVTVQSARSIRTFPGRNVWMLTIANTYGDRVWFGTRCPLPCFDEHGDSNWPFLRRLAKQKGITLRLPAMLKPKFWIKAAVRRANRAAARAVYSTEGWQPCE